MKINTRSWHYRLLNWSWGQTDEFPPASLCTYFWALVGVVPLSVAAGVVMCAFALAVAGSVVVVLLGPVSLSVWWLLDPVWTTHTVTPGGIGWIGESQQYVMPMWGRLIPAAIQLPIWWVVYSYAHRKYQIKALPPLPVPYGQAVGEVAGMAMRTVCPRIEYHH